MSKKTKGTFSNLTERERHRVAASITREADWEQPEPNSGLARMFVIMLLIHVFVIGGIIIYDFVGGDSQPKSSQASGTVTATKASSNSTAVNVSSAPLPTITSTKPSAPAQVVSAPAPKPTLSVPEAPSLFVTKAVPYTGPASLTESSAGSPAGTPASISLPKPVLVAHANTSDPIAFKSDAVTHPSESASVISTRAAEPDREAEKAKPQADKPKTSSTTKSNSDKPKVVADKPSSSQPKPVPTPSAARKSLAGDSKPPAAVASKKHSKEESDPPSAKKSSKSSSTKHALTKGDTIYSLARHYKISEETLMKANGIKNPNALTVGKVITIPAAK